MRLFQQNLAATYTQIRFWQQILKYHQRTLGLRGTRPVSLAILDGFRFNGETVWVDKEADWHVQLNTFLMKHNSCVLHTLDIATIVDKVKQQHVKQYSKII